ncbi:MAG: helix-turn-helix domain-containing protein [bacterium]
MENETVMTTNEAIEYLKTTKKTFLRMVHEGKIRGNKLGRSYRFLREDLDRFVRGETDELKAASK